MIESETIGDSLPHQQEQTIFYDREVSDEAWLSTLATVDPTDWR